MPNPASDADLAAAKSFLEKAGFKHLRCRRRADTVVIESGPLDDSVPHVRFRKLGAHVWDTQAATHTGRWEPMPLRGPLAENLQTIAEVFPWLFS